MSGPRIFALPSFYAFHDLLTASILRFVSFGLACSVFSRIYPIHHFTRVLAHGPLPPATYRSYLISHANRKHAASDSACFTSKRAEVAKPA